MPALMRYLASRAALNYAHIVKITVIGGANVDVTGRSVDPLRMADSNPARVHLSAGGVGRNIAENLFRLGAETLFVGAVGDDRFAEVLRGFFAETGMESSGLITRRGMNTGLYLDLVEPSGDLFVAINDMEAVESLSPADAAAIAPLLAGSSLAVLDANLKVETLEALADIAGKEGIPLMADSVSISKVGRLKPILGRLAILKANRGEAAALAGFPLDSDAALGEGCTALLAAGVGEIHITLGARGSCSAAKGGGIVFQKTLPGKKINVNGAGDAFAAGAAYRYCSALLRKPGIPPDPAEDALFGAACAAITLESGDAVSRLLNPGSVESRLAESRLAESR
jgi:pseudouridine kinase